MTQHTSGYLEVVRDGKTESGIETGHYEMSNEPRCELVCDFCGHFVSECKCNEVEDMRVERMHQRKTLVYLAEKEAIRQENRRVWGSFWYYFGLCLLSGAIGSLLTLMVMGVTL